MITRSMTLTVTFIRKIGKFATGGIHVSRTRFFLLFERTWVTDLNDWLIFSIVKKKNYRNATYDATLTDQQNVSLESSIGKW